MSVRSVDILWLIEHVDRELDVAVCCALEIERRFGLTIEVANYYRDCATVVAEVRPRVVVVPFFYSADDSGSAVYLDAFPGATFIDLRWEQLLYKANTALKRLRGEVAQRTIQHVAWTDENRRNLIEQGVPPAHVHLAGNPAFMLYREPYRRAFAPREALAARFGLDPARKWLFFPENYRWAFTNDKTLQKLERRQVGVVATDLAELRAYCQESLNAVVGWLDRAARESGYEVIVRPRPSTPAAAFQALVHDLLPDPGPRLHIVKDLSVREWALASDHVMSSFSTTLIEASLAGKPINTVTPGPVPELLRYDWCALVPDLTSPEALLAALEHPAEHSDSTRLARWAGDTFRPVGDAIVALADAVGLVTVGRVLDPAPAAPPGPQVAVPKAFFSAPTHDKDLWTAEELASRRDRMARSLDDSVARATTRSVSVVICTYNRAGYLEKMLESLACQQPHTLDLEVLVVDNRCIDDTRAMVRERQTSMPVLRYCFEPRVGLSHARNRGLHAARHRYLLYLDDDAYLPDHFLRVAGEILEQHEPDFFGGPVDPVYVDPKPAWFPDEFERRKYAHEAGWSYRRGISGGNFGVRRDLLQTLGGFDPQLGMSGGSMRFMEERAVIEQYRLLTPKRRQRVYYHPELFIWHHVTGNKMTLRYQMRRGYTISKAGVLLKSRLGLATGLVAGGASAAGELAGRTLADTSRVPLEAARTLVTSVPPRMSARLAQALVDAARDIGEIVGWFELRRQRPLEVPAPSGVLFIRAKCLTRLFCTREDHDAMVELADALGIRAGLLQFDGTEAAAIQHSLREERFRCYRRIVVLGYLRASDKAYLQALCGSTEVLDLRDVSIPMMSSDAGHTDGLRVSRETWLRALATADRERRDASRRGLLVVSGPMLASARLNRDGRDRFLEWLGGSGLRVSHVRLNAEHAGDDLAKARAASYRAMLALGALSADGRAQLTELAGATQVLDLTEFPVDTSVLVAAGSGRPDGASVDAARLFAALRDLAGQA